ncbi:MAG: rhodanese-like domain-containing protein [Anaerolineae bacterium]|nr:rhodanese-like domain-containing protein [Anaerolineae bacterium]
MAIDALPLPPKTARRVILYLPESELHELVAKGAFIIDTRSSNAFANHHVHGTINIPYDSSQFNTWVGWFVDYSKPTYLIIEESHLANALKSLRAIGVDDVAGVFDVDIAQKHDAHFRQVNPSDVRYIENAVVLDVRSRTERAEGYIADSLFIPMGELLGRLNELPKGKTIITQCGAGVRSQVVASLLQNHKFDVMNMVGGIDAWRKMGLPIESDDLVPA